MSGSAKAPPPFICPHCDQELSLPSDDRHYYSCAHCGKLIDLPAQFAFLRGVAAFDEAQDAYQALKKERKKRLPSYTAAEGRIVRTFVEAYSSIQVAFSSELTDHQRSLGIEMMANMTLLFLKHEMVSGLEVSYWKALMVEQTAQNEYDLLRQKLKASVNAAGVIRRLRWRARQNQLKRALAQIDKRIKLIEGSIAFVDPPRARRKGWKPLD